MTIEQILEAIEQMKVTELNELVKAAEEKFGVSAAAPVMVAGAAAGAAAEEKTEFDVVLANAGASKVKVIKDFMEAHPKMKLKMGVVEGEFYNEAQIVEFANIPPREVLLAKLLGSLKAPMSNFVYLVDALVKEKEGQEA